MSKEILAAMLLTWHNLFYYQEIMNSMRKAIATSSLDVFVDTFSSQQAAGDIEQI